MDYSRQIITMGKKNQKILSEKKVAVIGCGGLGNISAMLLCLSGINLILVDHDNVSMSNLHRMPLFTVDNIGRNKAEVAAEILKKHNDSVEITHFGEKVKKTHIDKADIVLDCTDSFRSKYLLNKYCIEEEKPLVYASVSGYDGQVMFIHKSACLRCLVPNGYDNPCSLVGAIPAVVSIIASIQAMQVINFFTKKSVLRNKLLVYNARNNIFETLNVKKRSNCQDCGIKKVKLDFFVIQPCKAKAAFNINPKKPLHLDLMNIKLPYKIITKTPYVAVIEVDGTNCTVYKNGKLLITCDKERAESIARKVYKELL